MIKSLLVWVAEEVMKVQEEVVCLFIYASPIRLLLPAPYVFFLHPHKFLNSETDLDLLFEKGHCSYQKSGSGNVLRIHQSGTESFFFSRRGDVMEAYFA